MCLLCAVLEKKLNEIETEKFNIKQMKDLFEQKAAQLATEMVGKCATGQEWKFTEWPFLSAKHDYGHMFMCYRPQVFREVISCIWWDPDWLG